MHGLAPRSTSDTPPASGSRNRQDILVFWIGNTRVAIPMSQVLSVAQEPSQVQEVPMQARGLLGVVHYLTQPVTLYDFARLLGFPSLRETRSEIIQTLFAREQDHIDWLNALEVSLRTDADFTKARDPAQCAFGKWYANFKPTDEELAEIMAEFDEPHRRIHGLADRLLEMKSDGAVDEALELLADERRTTLSRLRRLFEHARTRIQDSIRPVVVYLTTDGSEPLVALRVDDVHSVASFTPDQVRPVDRIGLPPELADKTLFSGLITLSGGDTCLLMETAEILRNVELTAENPA